MNGVHGEEEARPKCRTDSGKQAEGQEANPQASEGMKQEVGEMEAQRVRPPKAVVQGEGKGHQGTLPEEPFAGKEPLEGKEPMELGVIDDHRKVIPDEAVSQGSGVKQDRDQEENPERPAGNSAHGVIIPEMMRRIQVSAPREPMENRALRRL
jgi:hypothetical protein